MRTQRIQTSSGATPEPKKKHIPHSHSRCSKIYISCSHIIIIIIHSFISHHCEPVWQSCNEILKLPDHSLQPENEKCLSAPAGSPQCRILAGAAARKTGFKQIFTHAGGRLKPNRSVLLVTHLFVLKTGSPGYPVLLHLLLLLLLLLFLGFN